MFLTQTQVNKLREKVENNMSTDIKLSKSLTPFHPLTIFEITEYFKDEKRFNGAYSRNNLSKLKKGAYVINLDHSKNTETY